MSATEWWSPVLSLWYVRFCAACGQLYVGASDSTRCHNEHHSLMPIAASPERYAAWLVGGADAVRALSEIDGQLPGDVALAHQGHCVCDLCETGRMVQLAP